MKKLLLTLVIALLAMFMVACGSGNVVEDAVDAAGDMAGDAADMAGDAVDTAGDMAGDAADMAGDAVDAAGDMAGDAVDAAGDMAGDAVDAAGDAAGAVAETAGDAAGAVGDAAGDVVDAAGDMAGDAADMAGDAVDAAGDMAGDAADAVGDAAGDAADMAGDAAGAVGDAAGDAVDAAGDMAGDAVDAVSGEGDMEMVGTIADVAAGAGSFETLLAALGAAGLAETFADADAGPFTVFAPTDDAFAALPEGTVEALLEDPAGDLTNILTYHVVEGVVMAETVVTLDSATTLLGEDVSIAVVDGGVVLNDSVNVVTTDIQADNGVIHVIDGVLLPPAEAAEESAGAVDAGSATTYAINLDESTLGWNGAKVGSAHNGNISISEGSLVVNDGALVDGSFVIDMTSITNSDLSGGQQTKLLDHLNSADFFDTATHPTAELVITSAEATENENEYAVTGDLTIKGITNAIDFTATAVEEGVGLTADADIVFDRALFDVQYGSGVFGFVGDELIDDEIGMTVSLVATDTSAAVAD